MWSSVVNKSKDNGEMYAISVFFFTTNLNRQAERVFLLRDGSHHLRASVLLLITAESQSQTSQVVKRFLGFLPS